MAKSSSKMAKARAARRPADPNESKGAKFVRLANARVPKAIHALTRVGMLANRQNYAFTDSQAEKVIAALDDAMEKLLKRFQAAKEEASTFALEAPAATVGAA